MSKRVFTVCNSLFQQSDAKKNEDAVQDLANFAINSEEPNDDRPKSVAELKKIF